MTMATFYHNKCLHIQIFMTGIQRLYFLGRRAWAFFTISWHQNRWKYSNNQQKFLHTGQKLNKKVSKKLKQFCSLMLVLRAPEEGSRGKKLFVPSVSILTASNTAPTVTLMKFIFLAEAELTDPLQIPMDSKTAFWLHFSSVVGLLGQGLLNPFLGLLSWQTGTRLGATCQSQPILIVAIFQKLIPRCLLPSISPHQGGMQARKEITWIRTTNGKLMIQINTELSWAWALQKCQRGLILVKDIFSLVIMDLNAA